MGCVFYQTRLFSFGHHADAHFESGSFSRAFFLMIIFKLFVEVVGCFVFERVD